jgi:hypothetical protein
LGRRGIKTKVSKFLKRLFSRKEKKEASRTYDLKELVSGRTKTEQLFLERFEKEYEEEIKNAE